MNRRRFLSLLGIAAIGAACGPAASSPTAAPTAAPAKAVATTPPKPAATTPAQPAATTGAAPATKATAPATPQQLAKLRIGEIANVFENAYTFVGEEQGLYRKFGIDTEFVNFRDAGTMIKALLADEIDICEAGIEPLLPASLGGAGLKVIGSTRPKLNFSLFAKTQYKSVEDLRGASFATAAPGSFLHNIVVATLQKHNIRPDEVEFVNVGSSPDAFAAVDSGKVDAAPGSFDFIPTAEKNPNIHIVTSITEELPLYLRVSLYTTDKLLQDKPDTVVNFMKGIASSIRFGIENKEEIVKVGTTRLGRKAEEVSFGHDQEIKNQILAPNLAFTRENIDFMQQLLTSVGTIPQPLPFEKIATLQYQQRVVQELGEYHYK